MTPSEVLERISGAVKDSGELPDYTSYVTREVNYDGQEDANVDLPLIEVFFVDDTRATVHNTDLAGYVTDSDGNRTGAIYEPEWEGRVQINAWTVPQDLASSSQPDWIFDPRELGARVRTALWRHDAHTVGAPFTDEDGNHEDELTYFKLEQSQPDNEHITSPTLLRWRQDAVVHYHERITTEDDYIEVVDTPSSGDLTSPDSDLIIERNI